MQRKAIGQRNGLKIYTRLKTKKINPVSKSQKKKNTLLCEQRKILLSKANDLCQICNNLPDFRGLAVHHKQFRSKGGNHDLENLVVVCGKCHDELHGIRSGKCQK